MAPASTAPTLTTTSYAVLGLLALRPWTTYELAKQMERSLRNFWPRAESKLYEEPKKLVAHGLARATGEQVGRRPRTVYSITAKGRRALRRWLAEPGAGPVLEFEALLKVFFADQAGKAELVAQLEAVRAWGAAKAAVDGAWARHYLEGQVQFPDRAAVVTLVGRLQADVGRAVAEWAEWASAEVGGWPEDVRQGRVATEVLARIAAAAPEGDGVAPHPSLPPLP